MNYPPDGRRVAKRDKVNKMEYTPPPVPGWTVIPNKTTGFAYIKESLLVIANLPGEPARHISISTEGTDRMPTEEEIEIVRKDFNIPDAPALNIGTNVVHLYEFT